MRTNGGMGGLSWLLIIWGAIVVIGLWLAAHYAGAGTQ